MIYDIRHVTTYAYESPVSYARCTLRLEPLSGHGQQLVFKFSQLQMKVDARHSSL